MSKPDLLSPLILPGSCYSAKWTKSGFKRKVIEAALFQSQLKLRPYHAIRTEAA
jgi:hypothetical protein